MNKLLRLYVRLKYSEKGATAIEYAILVTFIAVAIIGAVTALGVVIRNAFNAAAAKLST
ncbi:MAG: Flp family type IVb pilin [Chloroflexi bacterium]|nr:Flp family type IVb pilin [Chloroflexota bacterium]